MDARFPENDPVDARSLSPASGPTLVKQFAPGESDKRGGSPSAWTP